MGGRGLAYVFQIWRGFVAEFTNNGKPPNLKSVNLTPKSSTCSFFEDMSNQSNHPRNSPVAAERFPFPAT
ncbi:MAG: hypothetical protein O3A00_03340 [Planctomycetota bacterium]|nr:hypothetical protein [Planctomycetota bacterium]